YPTPKIIMTTKPTRFMCAWAGRYTTHAGWIAIARPSVMPAMNQSRLARMNALANQSIGELRQGDRSVQPRVVLLPVRSARPARNAGTPDRVQVIPDIRSSLLLESEKGAVFTRGVSVTRSCAARNPD